MSVPSAFFNVYDIFDVDIDNVNIDIVDIANVNIDIVDIFAANLNNSVSNLIWKSATKLIFGQLRHF